MIFKHILLCTLVSSLIWVANGENKYSQSANEKQNKDVDFRSLQKPFRMNKLNLLWMKAQQRLTEPKLKSLYSNLLIQDKEELLYKRIKHETDKEGLKEAELRRKLTSIMDVYGLREHFDDNTIGRQKENAAFNSANDDYINKSLFKDKKLNQLWGNAEMAGLSREELYVLKEEFLHHQEKINQYYDLLANMETKVKEEYKNAVDDEEIDEFNEINYEKDNGEKLDKNFLDKSNLLREKHRGLRDGYDRLTRLAAKGPNREFMEPKVQGLWLLAKVSNFTVDELASLKVELQHYENRLLKLRSLHAEQVRYLDNLHSKVAATGDKMDHFADQQQMIKKHSRKVEKMHADLEGRILARHTEL